MSGVMDHEEAVRRILAEMDEMCDWASVAGALGALGVNPYYAEEHHVRFVLDTVLASDRLQLGRVGGTGFDPLPGPVSVENLLDELYRSPEQEPGLAERLLPGAPSALTVERVGAMMQVFIADRLGIAGR